MSERVGSRRIVYGVLHTIGPMLVASLFSAGTVFLMLRSSTPAEWGTIAASVSVAQFSGGMLDMGASTAAVRQLSKPSQSFQDVSTFATLTVARLTLWRVLLIVGTLLWLAASMGFSWWLILLAASVFTNVGATVLLVAKCRFFAAAMMAVIDKGTALSIVAVSSLYGNVTMSTYPAALGIGSSIATVMALYLSGMRKTLIVPLFSKSVTRIWSGSISFGIANNAPSLLLFDVAIVVACANRHEAGLFALGARLVAPLSIAATAITRVVFPLFSHRTLSFPSRRTIATAAVAVGGILVGLLSLLAAASWWVPTLFGTEYDDAIWPVRLYIFNVCVVLFTRTYATLLQSQERERAVSIFILVSTLLALALLAVGAFTFGAIGASFGVLISNLVLVSMFAWYTRATRVFSRNE